MTLLELLVAMTIVSLLLLFGVPGWGSFMAERELEDRASALLHTLEHARSEAIKRGSRVNVCPRGGGGCPGSAAAWEAGWVMVPTLAGGDPANSVIAQEHRAPPGVTIRGNRPVADYVSFTSPGYARRIDGALQMGTFTVCRSGHQARKVILANSGRARLEQSSDLCP